MFLRTVQGWLRVCHMLFRTCWGWHKARQEAVLGISSVLGIWHEEGLLSFVRKLSQVTQFSAGYRLLCLDIALHPILGSI